MKLRDYKQNGGILLKPRKFNMEIATTTEMACIAENYRQNEIVSAITKAAQVGKREITLDSGFNVKEKDIKILKLRGYTIKEIDGAVINLKQSKDYVVTW